MLEFVQASGKFYRDGKYIGTGYAGRGEGLDNPNEDHIKDIGPIPAGEYTLGDFYDDPGGKGPVVCKLFPTSSTDTHGRAGFMIHGDNKEHNYTASHGCIILPRNVRELIRDSKDKHLTVYHTDADLMLTQAA